MLQAGWDSARPIPPLYCDDDDLRRVPTGTTSLRRAADDGQPWDMLSDELRGTKTRHTWRGGERPDELRRLPLRSAN